MSAVETVTRRIGREIFERVEAAAPSMLSREYWQQAAMDWLGGDENLRMRVFRFIEVLPALRDGPAVARHLLEYLRPDAQESGRLPGPLALALGFDRPDSLQGRLAAAAARAACMQMARRFVCGSTFEEAIESVLDLRRRGMAFTIDVLGETVIADRVAAAHATLYGNLVTELARAAPSWPAAPHLDSAPWGRVPRANVSIKLSALVASFDPIDPARTIESVLDRLRPILRAARDGGAFVRIDMEHYAVKDLTLEIFKRVLSEAEFRDWPDCGIVLQAYLTECERDLGELIAFAGRRGAPVGVRLVKGAYWDYETISALLAGRDPPVWAQKWQSDETFERCAVLLLENSDVLRPAFASHNVRSIAAALAHQQALGLPPRTLELQMLTGMGDPLKRALVEMDQRVRIYAPFGGLIRGMAYLIRRLIENTSNESFLRQSAGGQVPVEELLRAPREQAAVATQPIYRPFILDPDEYAEMNPFINETEIDFARPESRRAMQAALAAVREQFGRRRPAWIGGAAVETPAWSDSHNPSNPAQIVGRTAVCDAALVDRAVTAARAAQPAWGQEAPERRAGVLERAAELLAERRFEAAAWQVYEVGKTWREGHGDVLEAIDYLRFYAYEARRLSEGRRRRNFPGESNEYFYVPRGVVAVLSPYCFPHALLAGMTAAALAAGNAVVMKPATQASVCAAWLYDLLTAAGLPEGVLNYLPGPGRSVGDALARHPDVDMIAFTGSSAVGGQLVELARKPRPAADAPHRAGFKQVLADMGGKNAIIVDDDADLDDAAQAVVGSAFGYSGQKCTACSRVVVLDAVYDDFLSRLVEAARGIQPGPADAPATSVGPMIDDESVERVRRYVEIGRGEGRCVLDGTEGAAGLFVGPTIFADVPSRARIAQEEIFGPVLAVIRARDFDQAVDFANDTPYALTGGVYSRSPTNIEKARRRLRAGTLYVNRRITASRVDRQPFGGTGMSGLGTKTGGPDYLLQFMVPRTISEYTMRHGFAPAAAPPAWTDESHDSKVPMVSSS